MNNNINKWFIGTIIGTCCVAMSCGRSTSTQTCRVTGTLVMDGEPLVGATVSFEPIGGTDSKLGAQGVTDEQGKFSLQTYVGPNQFQEGLQPGEYGVTVTKLDVAQDMSRRPKELLPKKYQAVATSGFTATVEAKSSNDFEFELKKK